MKYASWFVGLALAVSASTTSAQVAQQSAAAQPSRPAPQMIGYGTRGNAGNHNFASGMLSWAYWSWDHGVCVESNGRISCTVNAGNGDGQPHSICMEAAALALGVDTVSLELTLGEVMHASASRTNGGGRKELCVEISPHST